MKRLSVLILIILAGLVHAALAQDAPLTIYRAAVRAANAVQPALGEPSSWQFELLGKTSLSSLGCPLVQGAEMGHSVTPYRITLTYSGGQYVVYVSTDGSLVQLCDTKFGTPTAATPAPPTGCELAAAANPAARLAPDIDAAVINSGGVLTGGKTYAIGRSAQKSWYQVQTLNKAIGWIDATTVTASGECDSVPVTALPNADFDGNTCFVTPAAGFSNVRQRPSTENPVVAQLFEGTYWQVFVRNTAGDWYYINPGWISLRVVQTYGICEGLETNDELVGVGMNFLNPDLVTPVPGTTPAPVIVNPVNLSTPLPAQFTCPTDFAGFMPPRLVRGAANARVTPGNDPNRLRSEPSVSAGQVGTVQPERVLDAVLAGPACSGTFVWWLVEIDGVRGWTAESDSSLKAYFLEPPGVVVNPTATPGTSIATNPAQPTPSGDGSLFLAQVTLQNGSDAQQVIFSADGQHLAAWAQADAFVQVWDISNLNAIPAPGAVPAEGTPKITEIGASPSNGLAVLTEDNVLHVYDFTTLNLAATMFDVDKLSTLAFSPDGKLLLTVTCNNPDCTQGRIDLRDATDGHILRSQPAHPGRPGGAVFSRDGLHIASWGSDGVQVWDTQSGAFVTGFASATYLNSNVVFDQDGTRLIQAVCSSYNPDGTCSFTDVAFFESASGRFIESIPEVLIDSASQIALSADGLTLAVTGTEGAMLWDIATKQKLADMPVGAIAFSPDGQWLVAKAAETGTLGFYPVPADDNSSGVAAI